LVIWPWPDSTALGRRLTIGQHVRPEQECNRLTVIESVDRGETRLLPFKPQLMIGEAFALGDSNA
jgi:hypothetical protein